MHGPLIKLPNLQLLTCPMDNNEVGSLAMIVIHQHKVWLALIWSKDSLELNLGIQMNSEYFRQYQLDLWTCWTLSPGNYNILSWLAWSYEWKKKHCYIDITV